VRLNGAQWRTCFLLRGKFRANGTGTSGLFQTVTPESVVTVGKCEKSNNDGLCNGVTVAKGEVSKNATNEGPWPPVCEYCGIPERPGKPVQPYPKGGQTYLLHPACWTEWLAGPDPDGWTFIWMTRRRQADEY